MLNPFSSPEPLLAFLRATPEASFNCGNGANCALTRFVRQAGFPDGVVYLRFFENPFEKTAAEHEVPFWATAVYTTNSQLSTFAEAADRVEAYLAREAAHA